MDENGLLRTDNGLYCRWEPFNEEWKLRDSILTIYEKYPDIFKPYHIFSPKPNWGRDIYIGDDYVVETCEEILDIIKDYNDNTIFMINYDNGMGFTFETWQESDEVKVYE